MILKSIFSAAVILLLLGGWLAVQALARRFAARHPELGPPPATSGCGGGCCGCSSARSGCQTVEGRAERREERAGT